MMASLDCTKIQEQQRIQPYFARSLRFFASIMANSSAVLFLAGGAFDGVSSVGGGFCSFRVDGGGGASEA
jgi:hypothetical protein